MFGRVEWVINVLYCIAGWYLVKKMQISKDNDSLTEWKFWLAAPSFKTDMLIYWNEESVWRCLSKIVSLYNTEDGSFLWNISTAHYSVSLKLDNVINPCMPLWRITKKAFQKINITWNTYIMFIEKHTPTFILHWHLNTNEFNYFWDG